MVERQPAVIPKLNLPSEDPSEEPRNTSPTRTRPFSHTESSSRRQTTKSNPSPSRSASQQSTAAPTQTSSTASIDDTLDSSKERHQKLTQDTPSWLTSPRLKSPPPSSVRAVSVRRNDNDQTQSNTAIKRLAPASVPELTVAMQLQPDSQRDTSASYTNLRSCRGSSAQTTGLETVVEGSVPTTPSIGPVGHSSHGAHVDSTALEAVPEHKAELINDKTDSTQPVDTSDRPTTENADTTSASVPTSRTTSNSRIGANLAKKSVTSLTGTSKKPAIEPMRTMTVETETVDPTPQLLGDRGRDAGSVRTKPSTETIRPKRDKKKTSRKAPSLHAGTATSKADIFEAKVASAVDEADSSDSDETFVYESNPPEPPRHGRHHSRTPSATSLASQIDPFGARAKHGMRSGSAALQGKKSMKFSSGGYGTQHDVDSVAGEGARHSTRNPSSANRHHHIGRYGRNSHASILDNDSPFTQANRTSSPRTSTAASSRQPRPGSPRLANGKFFTSRKNIGGYDTYDDGADDERAPLVGSVRVNRSRHGRRPPNNFRTLDFHELPEPRWWSRVSGCVLLMILVALVSVGVATFAVALNRPLISVEVRSIRNVIASEQLLMLDLQVRATNPNLFAITVNDLDVNLLAESPYAGTSSEWNHGSGSLHRSTFVQRRTRTQKARELSWLPPIHQDDGVDEGTDPIDEEPGTQKLLLGRIFEFDSALVFDPSPLRHIPMSSIGEIRLAKPGNRTEVGGSVRWERVLQHPFDLIVRGVIKYQLPLSSRARTAKIGGRYTVSPDNDGDDDSGTNGTTLHDGQSG